MVPLKVLATVSTPEGELQLRQRGSDEFLITIEGRVLMTSRDRRSEQMLATLACQELAGVEAPRVVVAGLGMAYTLRAALDVLPPGARVIAAELTPEVEAWCRGPLAPLTNGAVLDPRVTVVIDDVGRVIAEAPGASLDGIILDLYEGPPARAIDVNEPFYGRRALESSFAALSPGGVLAIWSEDVNESFRKRMGDVGFTATAHRPGGARSYGVYVGVRPAARTATRTPPTRPPPARTTPARTPPARPTGRRRP